MPTLIRARIWAGSSARIDTLTGVQSSIWAGGSPPMVSLTDVATLAALTGTGTMELPVGSAGFSDVTGPANFYSVLTQKTEAAVEVRYIYQASASGRRPRPASPRILHRRP